MLTGRRCGGTAARSSPASSTLALVGRLEAGEHAQQRGLAAARRPEQREELALVDVEAEPVRPRRRRQSASRRRRTAPAARLRDPALAWSGVSFPMADPVPSLDADQSLNVQPEFRASIEGSSISPPGAAGGGKPGPPQRRGSHVTALAPSSRRVRGKRCRHCMCEASDCRRRGGTRRVNFGKANERESQMEFEDRGVVVTGGTGALGAAVVGALLEAGASLPCSLLLRAGGAAFPAPRPSPPDLHPGTDLTDEAAVAGSMARSRIPGLRSISPAALPPGR